jgi:hypothetical protein
MRLELFACQSFSFSREPRLTHGRSMPPTPLLQFGTESGSECNSRILREKLGWEGLLMDGGYANATINLNQEFITPGNINKLFNKYNVPGEDGAQFHPCLSVRLHSSSFLFIHVILSGFTALHRTSLPARMPYMLCIKQAPWHTFPMPAPPCTCR